MKNDFIATVIYLFRPFILAFKVCQHTYYKMREADAKSKFWSAKTDAQEEYYDNKADYYTDKLKNFKW